MGIQLNKILDIGTDVASFFLFHPDDLAHRREDPLDWHDYGFACRKEFEAGNLIAFRTGADGGYQLRFTGGDLTDAERARETGSWEWGYTVRHGKFLTDNGDFLPSEEARDIRKVPDDQWVFLPNGDYRVTVHPIERDDDTLPDYVIRFETTDKPLHIARSEAPPDLLPRRDTPPKAAAGGSADEIYKEKEDEPLAETYPLLVAAGQYLLPGGSLSLAVSDALWDSVRDEDGAPKENSLTNDTGDVYVVLAPNETLPGLGTIAWVNGSSRITGEPGRLRLRGERLVLIAGRTEGKLLPMARVEPVTRKREELGGKEFQALQAAFADYARSHEKGKNRIPSFERERVAAMTKGAALTARLIELAPLPGEMRFRLQAASDAERAKELITSLESA